MTKHLIGGLGLAAIAASAALAQVPAGGPRDAGHTKAEMLRHVQTMFTRADANRDGSITRAEAEAVRSEWRAQRQARRGERGAAAFDRIDSNRDGSISRQEFDAHRAQRQARRTDGGTQRAGIGRMALAGRMFDMADGNRDGRLTLQEATAAASRHFDMVDTNRDGTVSREERQHMRHAAGAVKGSR
ncbi:EF-hand domain-containing protein [Sphingomonas arenae]|uniref:EF-hand domain-containing protein n=1 Tax=Sphingomonas arenae TaxID=2812555 RepID=UPI00196743DA|nr:EF-hand domain-containing protein [Sphingomonas arenae]